MPEHPLEELARELVGPVLARAGITLVDVSWHPSRRTSVLRLTVDRAGGVTLDDCGRASELASEVLDQHESLTPGPYNLEVSSPGAERQLHEEADYQAAIGHRIRVHLANDASEQVVEGRLVSISATELGLVSRRSRSGRLVPTSVPRSLIRRAQVVVDL
jgi:ribosome maturation factor RimP